MRLDTRSLTSQKAGSAENQNDDRSYCGKPQRGEAHETCYLGIADGVSESLFAGRWAESVVEAREWRLLFQPDRFSTADVLSRMQTAALDRVESLGVKPMTDLPWYLRSKAARGSATTFLGVRLQQRRGDEGGARVLADVAGVGDCCAFHIRNDLVVAQFPVLGAHEFGRVPDAIRSIGRPAQSMVVRPDRAWRVRRGDALVLATDAVAHWLASSFGDDGREMDRLRRLLACEDDQTFGNLVDREREHGFMRNDDATVVIATRRA